MSFDAIEVALDLGQPIRLYKFTRGVITWAYNSSDRDVTYFGVIYKTLQGGITDSGIRQTGQGDSDALEITAAADIEVAQLFRSVGPASPIEITITDIHAGDYTDAIIVYMGSINAVKFPAENRCTIICNTDDAGLDQTGLRLTWARGCPHTHYGRGCLVNREAYKVNGAIAALDGAGITVTAAAAFSDDYFAGGYIEWSVGSAQFDQRGIESHTGSNLVLLGGTSGLTLALDIALFPGCDHSIQTCKDKFDNVLNYGGHPHQPGYSPFDNSPF